MVASDRLRRRLRSVRQRAVREVLFAKRVGPMQHAPALILGQMRFPAAGRAQLLHRDARPVIGFADLEFHPINRAAGICTAFKARRY